MYTIHCVCSPRHLRRWDRLQLGFPEGRLWCRGGWLHAEQGQPQPGRSLSFRLITITSPWCFCHLSLRFCRLSLGYYHEDVCGLCRTHMYEECPSHIYLKYLCGATRILLFLIIVIILEKIFSSFFPFLAVSISLCVSLSVLLHYNHHGNYHHCLVLRWPCAVDWALNSNYQLITVMKLFICLLQCIPCMDFYLIRNNVNCISPPPFHLQCFMHPEISLTITIGMKSLDISVAMPLTYQNQTRGLLGNFNGIQGDDFVLPNGTVLGSNLTERQIFEMFGSQCKQPQYSLYEDSNIDVLCSVLKHSYSSDTWGNVILTCCLSSTNTFSSPLEYLGSDWTVASFSDRGLWILTSSQNTNIPTHVHYSRCYCQFVSRDSFAAF